VTSLGDEIHVLRWRTQHPGNRQAEVDVYDVITYDSKRRVTVHNPGEFTDMTSCEHHRCLYLSDHVLKCVHRLDVKGTVARWAVHDFPRAVSVNPARNVLVTCGLIGRGGKIKEFTSRGYLLREITLPHDVGTPWHAIQTDGGQLFVCHGGHGDLIHRVCVLSPDGRQIVHSHGGPSGPGQYDVPRHLAVDSNEAVFVVDVVNRRVTLLSPTLQYVRQVVSPTQLRWWPYRLSLDARRRRLYVTENDFDEGRYRSGRVAVFSV